MKSYADFVAAYPEFADSSIYTESAFNYWIGAAYLQLDTQRFGNLLDLAAENLAAHNMVLEARAFKDAATGGTPGLATGMIANRSVDKASVGYSTADAAEKGGGQYNLTIYGQRYWRLARSCCLGPIYRSNTYAGRFGVFT